MGKTPHPIKKKTPRASTRLRAASSVKNEYRERKHRPDAARTYAPAVQPMP